MTRVLLVAALCALLPAASAGARSQLHMWTDAQGVVHVDDTPPPRTRTRRAQPRAQAPSQSRAHSQGRAETTGRAQAAARPAARWWERATDAPPDQIDHAALVYNIPAELVRSVIAVESAGDASAISRKGAIGLMQLMPGTAGEMYVEDPVDPAQNILGGTRYLRQLANQFGGDMLLTLAAYNAGPDAVRRYGGVPPFEETRQYVRKVMAHYRELKREAVRGRKLASAADTRQAQP